MKTKNHFELRGFVGNDPQVKILENEKKVVNLRLATNELQREAKGKDQKTLTDWHTISLWNGRADLAMKYIKKGALIAVERRVKPRSYERDGETKYTIDLVVDRLDIILNKEE